MKFEIAQRTIGSETVNSVSARELHKQLQVATAYSDWVKTRLEEAQLVENTDFLKFKEPNNNNRLTVILTIDAAKSIAMLERTPIGQQVRKYFIECEKIALAKPALPQTYVEALRALADKEEERLALAATNTTLQIKVREAETFNCLAGACNYFGWDQGAPAWRCAMGKVAATVQAQLGTRTEKIPDARYGVVNAHDNQVWEWIAANIPDFKKVRSLYEHLGWSTKNLPKSA